MAGLPRAGDAAGVRRGRGGFLAWALLAFVAALALRLLFLFTAQVDVRIRGDILGYWVYAANLLDFGTFSSATGEAARVGDSYRAPGYPAFLAACMWLAGTPERAVAVATLVQVLVGALLAPAVILVARQWLARPWALAAGFLVAFWPQLVVMSSTLLSETLFALALLAWLGLSARAAATGTRAWSAAGGLAGAAAWLVNPLALFLPLLAAALLWMRRHRAGALALLLAFALPAGAWTLRNAMLPAGAQASDRAWINLVQGSWPLYHAAQNDRRRNPIARNLADAIAAEEQLVLADRAAGLRAIGARFAADPAHYLAWYLWRKPALLWGWGVGLGAGDIYVLETRGSPYERNAALRATYLAYRALNPAFTLLAFLAAAACLVALARRRDPPAGLALAALAAAYVTCVHVVLQADPRYAAAYRPIEALLLVSLAAWLAARWGARRRAPAGAP